MTQPNNQDSNRNGSSGPLELNFKPHTVILTCAPSGSGKTFLLSQISSLLESFNARRDNNLKLKYSVISSDACRYNLLQEKSDSLNKFDFRMSSVSKQAFQMLETELVSKISYPVNQHLIFVDTTGLNKAWREKIIGLAKEHNYNVDLLLFNYNDRKDFHKYSSNKFVTEKGVKRLYEEVLPALEKHLYNRVIKVLRHYNIEEISSEKLIDKETYDELNKVHHKSLELETAKDLYIFGDVHGCFFTLKRALESIFETTISADLRICPSENALNKRVILGGDMIDKGPFSKEVVTLCLANQDYITWVLGNHENFVHKCHADPTGVVKGVPHHIIDEYFTTIGQFKDDVEFVKLLDSFVKASYPFIQTSRLVVTHAPCKEKFIGKVSRVSKREQRNVSLFHAETKEEAEKLLGFLLTEADKNYPFHFFGHVATEKPFRIKNKISMDTAAVCGFGLTYFRFYNGLSGKPERQLVPTLEEDLKTNTFQKSPNYHTLFDEEKIDLENLDGKIKSRIDWACKNKVNYISGTMSPSSQEINEDNSIVSIESLKAGLDYYKSKGVNKVLLQPKYMGSRCNIYLNEKISDCYMISRNGYKINKLYKGKGVITNFRSLFKKIKNSPKVLALYDKYPNLETIILDGELLPWFALGKGLVFDTYNPLGSAINKELEALHNENFVKVLNDKLEALEVSLANPETHKQLANTNYRLSKTYEALAEMKDEGTLIDSNDLLRSLRSSLKKFEYQVKLFGSPGNLDFKPFSILKLVMRDGSEILPNYVESFNDIGTDTSIEIDLMSPQGYGNAQSFFEDLITSELEGVVIKPIIKDIRQITIAPYLKVRNGEYLRLIYGYDYLDNQKKYDKLSRKKDNRKKITVSINEFNIGLRMLQTPYKNISLTNLKYKELLATMIAEEAKEISLDPRL